MTAQQPPRVSIGLPVYNGEDYLAATLDSILGQTFTDFEVIVCDNGSTDDTAAIGAAYAARDSRIRRHAFAHNVGAAANYNRVFELSRGEYFKWAAHDDLLAPEFLARCVDVLDQMREVVVCYPATTLIDAEGRAFGSYADGLHLTARQPSERFRAFLDRHGLCHPVFGLIRRSALVQTALIGNYPTSDRNLLGELCLYGQFYELPDPLFLRRIHPNISTTVYPSERERAVWFDPQNAGRLVLPRWRRLLEYMKAIHRAPLSPYERWRCYGLLGRLAGSGHRWSGMLQDLAQAGRGSNLRAGRIKMRA